jgi:hypothetical protein
MDMGHMAWTQAGRLTRAVALGATFVIATAGGTAAEPDTGELPVAAFTHISVVDDDLTLADIYLGEADADPDVDIDTSGSIAVETIYTLERPDVGYETGWYRHSGPAIFTVTVGTLTFIDDSCQTFDLVAGQSYIESSGEILNAVLVPHKNLDGEAVGWFTTRLSPVGAAGPLPVSVPCAL